jgi:hypothetical protein
MTSTLVQLFEDRRDERVKILKSISTWAEQLVIDEVAHLPPPPRRTSTDGNDETQSLTSL